VIASVHLADVGGRAALRILRKAPKPGSIDGLRHADVGTVAPLSASLRKSPSLGRVGLVAFWESDDAVDRFLLNHPLAATMAGGWHARLEPLRAHGSWPGLPTDTPRARTTDYEGEAIVLTLGRFRLRRAVRFFRTSAKAEGRVLTAPGMIWATGIARPPFIATCSLWKNTAALSTDAYGGSEAAHPGAITADRATPFHHESAFIRFRPYDVQGSLAGKNPLREHALSANSTQ
jgi:hypothetical protein